MSILPCVLLAEQLKIRRLGPVSSFLLACLLCLAPVPSHSDEAIIISIILNQEQKGDFFVILRDDGDFLLRPDDLTAIGIRQLPDDRVYVGNEPLVSIREMVGIDYRLDEATLTLELTSRPELLAITSIDLAPIRQPGVIYSHDNSIFLNYGIDYTAGGKDWDFKELSISNELGVRYKEFLLLTDSLYTETSDEANIVRLNTRLVRDQENTLDRITIGDFFATSGDLGYQAHLGGISFSRDYDIDPYFINYPLFDFNGLLPLPSTVELFVDNRLIRSERLSPGEFELRNLQNVNGAQDIEVVIRDALGREQRIHTPFYFTDKLLRQGMHEFSYNLGLRRKNFGVESADYADLAALFFHRYGFSDHFNLGLRGEAREDLINLGAESLFLLSNYGLVRLAAAGSQASDDKGFTTLFSYDYQNRTFRARVATQLFTEDYRTLNEVVSESRAKHYVQGTVSYYSTDYGSFALDYLQTKRFDASRNETLAFTWSRRVFADTHLYVTLLQGKDIETYREASINLTWQFGRDHSATTSYHHTRAAEIQTAEVRKTVPSGAGTGWNVYGERTEQDDEETRQFGTSIQHNACHATLRGEYDRTERKSDETENVRLTLAGAVISLGGTTAFTRPVTDSFALVNVGRVEGVRVYRSNQLEGSTDANGDIIITDLTSYYDNHVAIEDQDVPLDNLMPQVQTFVSPPLRGGVCINFPLSRYRAFSGTLVWEETASGDRYPLELADISLEGYGTSISFQTDSRGSFYFDNEQAASDFASLQGCSTRNQPATDLLPPGSYRANIRMGEEVFSSNLTIPEVNEPYHEMGEITLRLTPVTDNVKPHQESGEPAEETPIFSPPEPTRQVN